MSSFLRLSGSNLGPFQVHHCGGMLIALRNPDRPQPHQLFLFVSKSRVSNSSGGRQLLVHEYCFGPITLVAQSLSVLIDLGDHVIATQTR